MAMGRGLGEDESSLSGFGVKQATYKLLQCGDHVFLHLLLDLDGYIDLGHVLVLVLMEKQGEHLMLGRDEGSKFPLRLCRHHFFCEVVPVRNSSDEEAFFVGV